LFGNLDALTLADDLEIAYFDRLKPKITGAFREQMEKRFIEFRGSYWRDHQTKKLELAKVPSGPSTFRVGPKMVNSPSGLAIAISTNVSTTTGFDDPKR